MARDALATMLEVEPDSFDLEVEVRLDSETGRAVAAAKKAAEAAKKAADVHSSASRRAVKQMLTEGFTVRDAGRLLGLSPQRVQQLSADRGAKRTAS
jgi:hypothetical protein